MKSKLWLLIWFGCGLIAQLLDLPIQLDRALGSPEFGIQYFHPLGFDPFGRDLLLTTLQGSVRSAGFAATATLIALLFATTLGTTLALAPAWCRFIFLRCLDGLLSFPFILFALGWAALYGPGWQSVFIALLIATVPSLTRLVFVRTETLLLENYVIASRCLGASSYQIWKNHLIPGVIPFSRVKLPNLFAHALMAETTLTFLGLGAPLGAQTWGTLLLQSRDNLIEAPLMALGTGLPLLATILALQNFSMMSARSRHLEAS